MKCPKCGYDFDERLDIEFQRQEERPNLMYICDECSQRVPIVYREKVEKFKESDHTSLISRKYIYLCVDCMKEKGLEEFLIGKDR